MQVRPSSLPALRSLSVLTAHLVLSNKTLCIMQGTALSPLFLIRPSCQCHLRMEGLPAQACDPLAVASEGPAHLLSCAWVPQENLKIEAHRITFPNLSLPHQRSSAHPYLPEDSDPAPRKRAPESLLSYPDPHLPGHSCSLKPASCHLGTKIC